MNSLRIIEPLTQNAGLIVPNQRRASRAWRVLHAADSAVTVASLVASQIAVGMDPTVVTTSGPVELAQLFTAPGPVDPPHVSLLNAWNNVRQWRKVILDAQPSFDFELLHAHTFASGMAGVRNCPVTIYVLEHFVEDIATAAAGENGSWLARSFRVAEQFVLTRAAAVVVPNESFRQAVIHRGAAAENVFAIPSAIDFDTIEKPAEDDEWLASHGIDRWHRVIITAPDWKLRLAPNGKLDDASRGLLEAFSMTVQEEEGAYLLVEVEDAAREEAKACAESLEISSRLVLLNVADRERAFAAANIVIADAALSSTITPRPNEVAARALLTGKALLAADLPPNRDITPSGRGCLWYRSGDNKDLAYRMAFLARNRDFRASLADSGRQFLADTRDAASIALNYDRVYRHAVARRKSGGLQTPAATLTPISAIV